MQDITTTSAVERTTAVERDLWWKLGGGGLMAATIVYGFGFTGPALAFPNPEGARAIFFHVPAAMTSIVCLTYAAWNSLLTLKHIGSNVPAAIASDAKATAGIETGVTLGIAGLVTGIIFSKLEWGAFWSWDPRQTSFLIACLFMALTLVLRGAVSDPMIRRRVAAAYLAFSYIPCLFLTFVLPRIVITLHGEANIAVIGGKLTGNYRIVMYFLALPAYLMIAGWLTQLRRRMHDLETRDELTL